MKSAYRHKYRRVQQLLNIIKLTGWDTPEGQIMRKIFYTGYINISSLYLGNEDTKDKALYIQNLVNLGLVYVQSGTIYIEKRCYT